MVSRRPGREPATGDAPGMAARGLRPDPASGPLRPEGPPDRRPGCRGARGDRPARAGAPRELIPDRPSHPALVARAPATVRLSRPVGPSWVSSPRVAREMEEVVEGKEG